MAARRHWYWRGALRALLIPVFALALTAGVGLRAASADGPAQMTNGGGNWSQGQTSGNWNWDHDWNWHNSYGNNCGWIGGWSWNSGGNWNPWCHFGYNQPMLYPVYQPSYIPVYVPAPAPVYSAPASSYSQPAPSVTISLSNYGPGWSAGMSQQDIQVVCHQYSVALQYNTMPDNPNLDSVCGTTVTSSSSAAPSSYQPANQPYTAPGPAPTSGQPYPSANPYQPYQPYP